jgi:hypothetical protein
MTQHDQPRTEDLLPLSSREMQEVLAGASVEHPLKYPGLDRDTATRAGTENGGVWKTTNFLVAY